MWQATNFDAEDIKRRLEAIEEAVLQQFRTAALLARQNLYRDQYLTQYHTRLSWMEKSSALIQSTLLSWILRAQGLFNSLTEV